MNRREVALAASLGPLDRAAEPPRNGERECFFRVDVQLRAEAAADIGSDHTELRLGNPCDPAQRDARDVRHLCGRPQRELARRRDRCHEHRARLDRIRDQPVLAVALRHGHRGLREQTVDLTRFERPRVARIRPELVVDEWRTVRERGLRIDDRRQRVVLDLDQLCRILRGAAARRCDHRDRVAGVPSLVDRHGLVFGSVRVLGRDPRAREGALPLVGEIRAGPRGDDAGVRERRRDVHLGDARVCVRAAHDAEIDHPVDTHVVHPLRLSLEELLVLFPLDRGADSRADLNFDRSSHRATASIASTMFWYPVQRQMLPSSACRISASLGRGFSSSRLTAASTMPLVQ